MSDPTEYLCLTMVLSVIFGAWCAVRFCADAVMSERKRNWWAKAVYRAQQRQEYAQFSKELDEVGELERMGLK
jgi:hypothetical protein